MIRSAIAIAVMLAAGAASAQTAIPPAKIELVQKVLQLWQVEALGETMLQQPVAEALGQARAVLQGRVPQEKQEAALRDINAEVKKFLDENSPLVRSNAQKLVPTTVMPMLAEKFTEEELKQIIVILESPVKKKFEQLMPEMQKSLGEKLAADTGSTIDPKLTALRERIGNRLRVAILP